MSNASRIADQLIEDVRFGRISADYDAVLEQIDQVVDGYCIYTSNCLEIMQETDNADAYADDFGGEGLRGESWSGIVSKFAWAALRRDVTDYLFREGCDPNTPESWGYKAECGTPDADGDVADWAPINEEVYPDQTDAEDIAAAYQEDHTGDAPIAVRVVNLAGDEV